MEDQPQSSVSACIARLLEAAQHRQNQPAITAQHEPDPIRDFRMLVRRDLLYVRVWDRRIHSPSLRGADTASTNRLVRNFRKAFSTVWSRITEPDKLTLMTYWRALRDVMDQFRDFPPAQPRPLIQIVFPDSNPPATAEYLGHVLNFLVSLVDAPASELQESICDQLVQTFLFASGIHWRMAVELEDRPMETWETANPSATESAADAKWTELENDFIRQRGLEIAEILRRWKISNGKPKRSSQTGN